MDARRAGSLGVTTAEGGSPSRGALYIAGDMMSSPKRYRSFAEEWLRKNVGGTGWRRLIPSLTRLLQSVAPQMPHDPDDRECECTECRQHRDETAAWKAQGDTP